jgi:hypothetical protein
LRRRGCDNCSPPTSSDLKSAFNVLGDVWTFLILTNKKQHVVLTQFFQVHASGDLFLAAINRLTFQ